ncbi:trimeric intracellular cation channel family protein [Alteriqipengyuania flavescens]|uniref:trimeric intracellular cation channel family protein n=1 Tax=Alteriqipengyuania flavescens TaxID=3053610 RepID=UPI0025B43092|nr:trimeric intracellular cation channel family protein [Alteriqipengyuania flavescens]WJY17952.1 trimeric intracellular cation channel family protein [Alteriqipengyuania flavescens]WJY23893.1 trimeric intracellular cation channel family protein [Alteriqipengyuania flavescens]
MDTETILTPLLDWLDLLGVAVFALSGALIAAKERQTFVTMAFFALVTGVGGGTIRDIMIDIPAFWVNDPWIAPICLGVALIAWFTPHRWWEGRLLEFADGAGLTAYAVIGTAKALAYGVTPVPAILMGIITGTAGGIIRDVIAGRPSILMRPELYVTAAALSASLTVAFEFVEPMPRWVGWIIAASAGYILRSLAITKGLELPAYSREKPRGDQPGKSSTSDMS